MSLHEPPLILVAMHKYRARSWKKQLISPAINKRLAHPDINKGKNQQHKEKEICYMDQ